MNEEYRSARDSRVRDVLTVLCTTAREDGTDEACELATAHLVAATAYLQDCVGSARTIRILTATINNIDPGKPGQH